MPSSIGIRRSTGFVAAAVLAALFTAGFFAPAPVQAREAAAPVTLSAGESSGQGLAVVYSDKLHGHKTASGKPYDKNKLSTAHKTFPFGTKLRLTNPKSGKSTVVTVTDRGPFEPDRTFDLSGAAAKALGIGKRGQAMVDYQVVQ